MAIEIIWRSTEQTLQRDTETGEVTVIAPESAVNAETLRDQARTALAALRAYRDLSDPGAADVAAQVGVQNRILIGLVRDFIGDLTGTD